MKKHRVSRIEFKILQKIKGHVFCFKKKRLKLSYNNKIITKAMELHACFLLFSVIICHQKRFGGKMPLFVDINLFV